MLYHILARFEFQFIYLLHLIISVAWKAWTYKFKDESTAEIPRDGFFFLFAWYLEKPFRNSAFRKLKCPDLSMILLPAEVKGCVPLGESGSGFLICGVPFEQIHFQIRDLSNPLWTRIHRITDLRDLKKDHWIIDPTRSFGPRIRN